MSKKVSRLLGLLVFLGIICFFHNSASAITVDGDLSDWGVTPFTQWTPTLAGTSYTVENNYNRQWSDAFSEQWDIEAMYVQDCQKYLNFAIVSSNPYNAGWANESLFLDFSGRTSNQLLMAGDYKYAANLAELPLDQLSTKGVYKVNPNALYTEPHHNGSPYIFPVSIAIGPGGLAAHQLLGTYQIYNKSLGGIEAGTWYPYTYVLEGRIDKSLFTEESLTCDTSAELYFSKVTCIKDWITVRDNLEGTCVPEPAALLLFGPGVLAVICFKRRKIA